MGCMGSKISEKYDVGGLIGKNTQIRCKDVLILARKLVLTTFF